MSSAFTHAFVAGSIGKSVAPENMPPRFWALSVLCSVIPDADVLGFFLGIPYESVLGHRGLSHSLIFAAALGFLAARLMSGTGFGWAGKIFPLWIYFSAVTASHGLLDAMTNGGLGVAFFAPLDSTRYFLPWRPLEAPPIGLAPFFGEWGMRVMASEFLYVWVPACLLLPVVQAASRLRRR
ncbi:metal-dependent hydrolase [bacterium]|nr:metal-dependent hydrolase [bacterium]